MKCTETKHKINIKNIRKLRIGMKSTPKYDPWECFACPKKARSTRNWISITFFFTYKWTTKITFRCKSLEIINILISDSLLHISSPRHGRHVYTVLCSVFPVIFMAQRGPMFFLSLPPTLLFDTLITHLHTAALNGALRVSRFLFVSASPARSHTLHAHNKTHHRPLDFFPSPDVVPP